MSMFEKATRLKVRFETTRGMLAIEDLWDLPLQSPSGKANLDDIARDLHRQLRSGDEISFVKPETKTNELLQMKFDLVKHVIDARVAENAATAAARDRAEKKQRLMELIADKQDETLKSKSVDELQKMLAEI